MPTYEYVCKTCGKVFEYFQPITAQPLKRCPVEICEMPAKGQGEVERKISGGVGLIFKGDGFYITDYVRKSQDGKGKTQEKSEDEKHGSNIRTEGAQQATSSEKSE